MAFTCASGPPAARQVQLRGVESELPRDRFGDAQWHRAAIDQRLHLDARRFYEAEAVRANWSRRDLERQINRSVLIGGEANDSGFRHQPS